MKYDLKKEKIAVHCQTLEEAEKVQLKFEEIYNTYYNLNSRHKYWKYYGSETCFCVDSENNNDFGYSPRSFYEEEGFTIITASEYLSQFEEVPKYGDTVWDASGGKWLVAGLINGYLCVFTSDEDKEAFEIGGIFDLFTLQNYRTTDPAKDKKVLELTMSEIAEKLGVDEVKIKE